MEESEHPPSEEPMSDVLDSNLTGCCNLLGLEGVTGSYLPESILAPDPVWTEGLQIPLDPFPEAITNSPNGDYAPVQRSGLLYEDTLELSQPLKLDQVVQLGYLEPSEPLEHNGNVQPESLGQNDDKWSGSLEQDRVEPLEQNRMTWSEPLEQEQAQVQQSKSLEQNQVKLSQPLEQDQVKPPESLEQIPVTCSEALERDQMEQSKSLEQNQVKLSQPLEQDQVKPPESLEQIPVTCSEALERDQMEQLESLEQNQVKYSQSLEQDQVKPPESLEQIPVTCSEALERDQMEQLESLEQNRVKLSPPLEQDQVKPPEPLELGQEEPKESMGRTEPLEQEKLQPLESEKGSPSNMDLEDTSKDDMGEVVMSSPEVPFPTEFEKYYRVVEVNPEDFDGWTYLLQYVEQENHMGAARKAFDSFLSRYPYCYGYWKKYAEMERRLSSTQMADEVFRRGLQAIPLSVDLWLHFVGFLRESAEAGDGDAERRVREVYEHAVLAAGTDFRSDRLWESYITWETELGNLANVTAIYDRLLTVPTQLYNHHFQRFREHVQNNLPKNFLSLEEFVELRKKLASVDGLSGEEVTPAEDISPGNEDLADPAKRVTEIENMRHSVLESRQEVFNLNETEVSKRWTFEEGIKRPYFHVKPLERTQLNVWREYLDFELENGTPERVVVLFERCLIACALYEEFWIKGMAWLAQDLTAEFDSYVSSLRPTLQKLILMYAKYLESYSVKGVRHVYQKACLTHLPRKTTVHLLWAAFEEQQGCIEEAKRILKNLDQVVPGLAVVRLRRVNLERRHGNLEEAESLLQDAIENGKSVSDSSFYSIKLARMLFKVQKSLQRARKVLLEAIEKDKTNPKLYLNLLELEYSGELVENEEQILSCFDRALSSPMPLQARLTFSQRKAEFLEDFGSDVNKLMASYEEHQKLLKVHDSIKRKAENGSQEPEPKRQCTEDASLATGHMMGQMMPDMHTSHAAYNYNWYQHYNYQNPWGYGHYYPPPST